MATTNIEYRDQLATLQTEILEFLRTFESIAENLRPGTLSDSQARIVTVVRDNFRRFESGFATLTPPAGAEELHRAVCDAVREFSKAYDLFMSKPGPEWTLAFLYSRGAFCRGLYHLYELREQLPIVASHFLLDGAKAPIASPPDGIARGFIHRKRNNQRSDYTLYIPED